MKHLLILLTVCAGTTLSSCTEEFLDAKPRKSLVVPRSLEDLQSLLDNANLVMNREPQLNLYADGDLEITGKGIDGLSSLIRNIYLWEKEPYGGQASVDWDKPYEQVLYANVVLEQLDKTTIPHNSGTTYENLKGSALFYRANAFFQLAQNFAEAYNPSIADSQPGIPIRIEADVALSSPRASLGNTYTRIIEDLKESIPLLPEQSLLITRPNKRAAIALLARVYLVMEDYKNALTYSGEALSKNDRLLDFNDLDTLSQSPFPNPLSNVTNPEIIYFSTINVTISNSGEIFAETNLLESYEKNDLRRRLFFNEKGNYRATFTGSNFCFGGMANDELYLIRAECLARSGNPDEALQILSGLLEKRYKRGTFSPLRSEEIPDVLKIVLQERRKELFARGLRWSDLKRLNRHAETSVTLTRAYQGEQLIMLPSDTRYLFPIPDDEILFSGIPQNPR